LGSKYHVISIIREYTISLQLCLTYGFVSKLRAVATEQDIIQVSQVQKECMGIA